jgi:hypothetical protein
MPINITVADITVIDPTFQKFIQFFILLLTVSAIILTFNSVVFPYWMDKAIKEDYMAPTQGLFVLLSTFIVGWCLIGSCISILLFFIGISYFMLLFLDVFSEFLWTCLTAAIILMLIEVLYVVCFFINDMLPLRIK